MEEIRDSEWINARQAFSKAPRPKAEPKIDAEVSKAVGFYVRVNDPRVIRKVAEWRRNKDPETQDYYLRDPKKVEELKLALR